MFIDFYRILGLSKNATKDEIKRKYRRLAKQYHPDLGGDSESFILLNRAYETLSNDRTRYAYDKLYDEFIMQHTNSNKRHYKENDSQNRESSQQKSNANSYRTYNENREKTTEQVQRDKVKNKNGFEIYFNWKLFGTLSVIFNLILISYIIINNVEEDNIRVSSSGYEGISQEVHSELLSENALLKEKISTLGVNYAELINDINELETEFLSDSEYDENVISENLSNEIIAKNDTASDDYIQLGDTKDHVQKVMGTPNSVIGDMWWYGNSTVTFWDGKVSGWDKQNSDELKVNIPKSNLDLSIFSMGSSYQDVVDVMGTPDSIIGDMWWYGYSTVTFADGKVSGWDNYNNELKIQ